MSNSLNEVNPYDSPTSASGDEIGSHVRRRYGNAVFLGLGCIPYFASRYLRVCIAAGDPFYGPWDVGDVFMWCLMSLGLGAMLAWMLALGVKVIRRRFHPLLLLLFIPAGFTCSSYVESFSEYLKDRRAWAEIEARL
jgi:hypothetical protein